MLHFYAEGQSYFAEGTFPDDLFLTGVAEDDPLELAGVELAAMLTESGAITPDTRTRIGSAMSSTPRPALNHHGPEYLRVSPSTSSTGRSECLVTGSSVILVVRVTLPRRLTVLVEIL